MTYQDQEQKIERILAQIDRDAEAGWCGNWADYTVTPAGALIVTFADGGKKTYRL